MRKIDERVNRLNSFINPSHVVKVIGTQIYTPIHLTTRMNGKPCWILFSSTFSEYEMNDILNKATVQELSEPIDWEKG